ncbi:MAG: polymer-forming cytoskeletal protein [Nitrospinota bacterium]
MADIKLKVLAEKDFLFLAKKNPEGVYDKKTLDKLHWIIKRLSIGLEYCTSDEKQLHKKFKNAVFGILFPKNTESREKLNHPGKVQVAGKFSGEIVAESVLIEKAATVIANIAADEVLCKGVVKGDIRATDKVKITKEAEVSGDIHSPNLNIEKGALFEGRCSRPRNRKLHSLPWISKITKRAG